MVAVCQLFLPLVYVCCHLCSFVLVCLQLTYICSMGKNKKNNYTKVDTLPHNAMKVSDYAKNIANCTTPYIYELIRKEKNNFSIVDFQGINFIIP